ncbi:anti-sigma-D factor RsdA [Labedaea rhizosphaerae]|uniref:Anti-sigma-D factor RsdA-like protein n=1 Tax=Labedaea rhizosphaerae TaxID=598644 RepID=A0A4R6SNB5_LABRH|nr:anti-sigma-D factor RsdA [Labedaea rhizosphaerae]TDQ05818.1 anti-sigma-D factor RsdA-like protein [Labedaea rhizosphaerae]
MADQQGRDGREWLDSVAHGFDHDDDLLPGRLHDDLMDAEAVDLAMVHADDALLDALAGLSGEDLDASLESDLAEDDLNKLLLSWRADVESEPMTEMVDTDTAVALVQSARLRRRHRPRLLVPVAAAAAVLAVSFTGVGLAARDAQPGSPLWGLTRVLYADHARSVEAAASARQDLADAKVALKTGNVNAAASALNNAKQELPAVSPEDGRDDLVAEHEQLLAQIPPPSGGTTTITIPVPPSATGTTTTPTAPSSPSGSVTEDPTSPSTPPSDTTQPTEPTTQPPPSSTTDGTGSSPRDDPSGDGTGTTGDGVSSNGITGDTQSGNVDPGSEQTTSSGG